MIGLLGVADWEGGGGYHIYVTMYIYLKDMRMG